MSEQNQNSRRFFRLSYPVDLMPTMTIKGQCYDVTEISEKGIRYYCEEFNAFRINEIVEGTITFKDGEQIPIAGAIIRHEHCDYVVGNISGLSLKRLLIEQRAVINRFMK